MNFVKNEFLIIYLNQIPVQNPLHLLVEIYLATERRLLSLELMVGLLPLSFPCPDSPLG